MTETDELVEGAAPRALPPPAIDPEDLIALVPGTSPEDAARYCSLATLAVEAAIWPNTLPDPLPPPLHAATLAIAGRFARSGTAGGQPAVVSESIGSYTYRLAEPLSADAALYLLDAELELLGPWLPEGKRSAFELHLGGAMVPWPVDWWQRNLDNREAAVDAALLGPSDPAALSGWAK